MLRGKIQSIGTGGMGIQRYRDVRFGTEPNPATLGIMVMAENETDAAERFAVMTKEHPQMPQIPDTTLGVAAKHNLRHFQEERAKQAARVSTFKKLWSAIQATGVDGLDSMGHIPNQTALECLEKVYHENKSEFEAFFMQSYDDPALGTRTPDKPLTPTELIRLLDANNSGSISLTELFTFSARFGVDMLSAYEFQETKVVTSFKQFVLQILQAMTTDIQVAALRSYDIPRSCVLHMGYIGTTDFALEEGDLAFASQCGVQWMKIHLAERERAMSDSQTNP